MTAAVFKLWAMSLQASVLTILVLIARMLLRKQPKRYSYILWIFVGIRLLCPIWIHIPCALPVNTAVLSDLILYSDESFRHTDIDSPDSVFETQSADKSAALLLEGRETNSAGDLSDIIKSSGKRLLPVLVLVYSAGAAFMVLFYLAQYIRLKRSIALAVKESDRVWLCETVESPFVFGLIHPSVYLPYSLKEPEKAFILRHEEAHIRHHDAFIRILGSICTCLHWWNPVIWLAVYKMNQDMEMYCDECAVASATFEEKKHYSETLLSFAMKKSHLMPGSYFGASSTELRIRNILCRKNVSAKPKAGVLFMISLCLLVLMINPLTSYDISESIPTDMATAAEQEGVTAQENITNLGIWESTGQYYTSAVYALSQNEIEQYKSVILEYKDDYYKTDIADHVNLKNKGYVQSVLTGKNLSEKYNLNLTQVGLTENAVIHFYASSDGSEKTTYGKYVFVIDSDTALVYLDGVFFEIKKI